MRDTVLYRVLKRILPRPIKSVLRAFLRRFRFRAALRAVMALPAGTVPGPALLTELSVGWGNEGYSADPAFLYEALRRVSRGEGPVLECGSGLSTILMGVMGMRSGVEVWALEHEARWVARVQAVLDRHRIRGVHLVLAPLKDFGEFGWYDAPWGRMPGGFRLIVCDGPPETTSGGRYGVVPLGKSRFAPGAVLLVHDANTKTGGVVVDRWRREHGAVAHLEGANARAYGVLTIG